MVFKYLITAIVVHESRRCHLIKVFHIAEQEVQRAGNQQGHNDAQGDDALDDTLRADEFVAAEDVEHHDGHEREHRGGQRAAAGGQDNHEKTDSYQDGALAALVVGHKAGDKEAEIVGGIGAQNIGVTHRADGTGSVIVARRGLGVKQFDGRLLEIN